MDEPKSFSNPEFLKDPDFLEDLKFINDKLSTTNPGQQANASQNLRDLSELADLAAQNAGEEFRLEQELQQACLATGATGAAIALVQGEKIVCHATAGPDAPDIGVCLDPHNGLSGSCIQTRRLQHCIDTETDSRVDPEASRTLGVRSIVVLPLIEGDKLFGIFEVLSSLAEAFDQHDLDTLQALTDRIVRNRSQNWESTSTETPKEPVLVAHKADEIVKTASPELGAALLPRERISRKTDWLAATLGVLVITTALVLGMLVGWRQGWQQATLALRASSTHYRASDSLKSGQVGRTLSVRNQLPPSSAGTDECGQSMAAGPSTQPPSAGLTVCQEGQVIFRLPGSAPSPTRKVRTAQHSLGLHPDSQRR